MVRALSETAITISVLDRLIDLEPGDRMENPLSRAQSVRLVRSAVRRDLEWLLNTRRIAELPEDGLREVNRSGYLYGLPELSSLSMASVQDRGRLLRQILTTINLFEPRLSEVRISVVEEQERGLNDVHLRVEAMLRMDPILEPVSFDTVIELRSGSCRLTGVDDAR